METPKEILNEYEMAKNRRRLDMWLIFRDMRVLFDEVERRTTEYTLLNLNEFLCIKCLRRRDKKVHDEVSQLRNVSQLKEKEPVWETPISIHRRSVMVDVIDYKTGKLLIQVREVFKLLESFKGSLVGSKLGERILEEIRKLNPKLMKDEQASDLIQKARKCASGERVCR